MITLQTGEHTWTAKLAENSITVYYDTNSRILTRLGKIQDCTLQELKDIFDAGDAKITFSTSWPCRYRITKCNEKLAGEWKCQTPI